MADTPKKTRSAAPKAAAAAKPRKTAAKKSAEGAAAESTNQSIHLAAPNGHAAAHGRSVSQEEVARLAHRFWQERGGKHGYHMEDWYRAEQELRSKAS